MDSGQAVVVVAVVAVVAGREEGEGARDKPWCGVVLRP